MPELPELSANPDMYESIVALLRENAKSGILPAHIASMPLSRETKLGDMGIDSLGKMGLLSALMELTDRYLADNTFNDNTTLGQIVDVIS